jgi:hypothetical protein
MTVKICVVNCSTGTLGGGCTAVTVAGPTLVATGMVSTTTVVWLPLGQPGLPGVHPLVTVRVSVAKMVSVVSLGASVTGTTVVETGTVSTTTVVWLPLGQPLLPGVHSLVTVRVSVLKMVSVVELGVSVIRTTVVETGIDSVMTVVWRPSGQPGLPGVHS